VYEVTARLNEIATPAIVHFALGQVKLQEEVPAKAVRVTFSKVRLPSGTGRLECIVDHSGLKTGVRDVEVRRTDSQ
jgi:hypothetical protein